MSWSLAGGLEEAGCDGLLVLSESSRDPDLAPFVGSAHIGGSFLVLERGAPGYLGYLTAMEREEAASSGLALLHPEALRVESARAAHGFSGRFWSEVLKNGLVLCGLAPTTLALAGRLALGIGHRALSDLESEGWRFVDGRPLLLRRRKSKSRGEQLAARSAAAGVCAAFRRSAELLASAEVTSSGDLACAGRPLSAGTLRSEIASVLAAHGLSQPEGNIVAAGAAAGVPHTKGDDARVLRRGETIVVDLFPKGELFADCTRTFFVGDPEGGAAAALEVVRQVLMTAHREARVGRRLWELQQMTCDLFSQAGLPTPISHPGTNRGYVHGLGHGVGFELHEYPSFARTAEGEGVLEVGDLFTLEPGLYDPDAGYGVRLEDLCLVTTSGVENLTPLPYDPDPRAWLA